MKLTNEVIETIVQLHVTGFSSREIAEKLGLGKSTVNDNLKKLRLNASNAAGPRVLLLDLETSAALAYCFGRFDVNLTENHIVEEGGKLLVAGWTWLGSSVVHSTYLNPKEIKEGNDYAIVKMLYDLYANADVIVAHNAKKFDHKMLQTRGVFWGLGRLSTVKVIDTLQVAKQHLRLPSNKLDSIANYFGLDRKTETSGIKLWIDVQSGCKKAMQEMQEYCKQDVVVLEQIFLKLSNLGFTGYNAALYFEDDTVRCKSCGSTNVEATGKHVHTASGSYDEMQCADCGTYSRGKVNKLSKAKRISLLA